MTRRPLRSIALLVTVLVAGLLAPMSAVAQAVPTFVVNDVGDAGDAGTDGVCATAAGVCTLRAAVDEANAVTGGARIEFAIPGGGLKEIRLADRLRLTSGDVVIDGYTQPESAVNTDPLKMAAVIRVQLRGTGLSGPEGIRLASPRNTVRGLAMYDFRQAIRIFGTTANDNKIVGNILGTDVTGTFKATSTSPGASGVHIQGGSNNDVGLPTLADRNVLSGNAHHGIATYDPETGFNRIRNNIIGLAPDGTRAVPNRNHGIDINFNSHDNVVGGTGALERNVVSGNLVEGIELSHGPRLSGNQIVGNFVGTDLSGSTGPAFAANKSFGIHLEDGASNNLVANNVVGNNGSTFANDRSGGGIGLKTASGKDYHSKGNVFRDNLVGVSVTGAAIPNRNWGMQITLDAIENVIGPGNVFANNPIGIWVTGNADTDRNTFTRNSFRDNGALGIDLHPSGVNNRNSPGDYDVNGPNDRLNSPILATASTSTVTGTACPGCKVEVFKAQADPTGYGEGSVYLGTAIAAGDRSFTLDVSGKGLASGDPLTATATDAVGNTSEFSQNRVVSGAPIAALTVTCTDLTCTLDASGSSDPGGSIASYAFDFGDGETATGPAAVVEHTYAAEGDIGVSVVVTDNSGETATATGTATPRAPAQPPTAALDVDCVDLGCTFDASASSDPDGTIVSYAFDFGDGTSTTGTDAVVQHAYAAGGDVAVSVTVTDDDGATDTADATADPRAPVAALLAADDFEREVSFGWGDADIGGSWSLGGSLGDYRVTDGEGNINVGATSQRLALLAGPHGDVDQAVRFRLSHVPEGFGGTVDLSARATSSTQRYRGSIRVASDGSVVARILRNNGSNAAARLADLDVPGLVYGDGDEFWVRFRAVGSSPTVLQLKVWQRGTAEPAAWTLETTDGAAALQSPAGLGVSALLGSGASTPLGVRLDAYRATNGSSSPVADGDSTVVASLVTSCTGLTCTLDASGSTTDATSIVSYEFTTGDGNRIVTADPVLEYTYASPGTYDVRVLAVDDRGSEGAADATASPTVTATEVVHDDFDRTLTRGWGTTTSGHVWSLGGSSRDYDVDGDRATVTVAPSSQRLGLVDVSLIDTDQTAEVSVDRLASGYGTVWGLSSRASGPRDRYRGDLRITPGGLVEALVLSHDGSYAPTEVGSAIAPISGVAPGDRLQLRFQTVGTNPTSLRLKVWRVTDPEPAGWLVETTDATAALQGPGNVGIGTILTRDAANRITTSVDDWHVLDLAPAP